MVRLWVSDRPGALGAVASRIGAAGGDVVGIEILERGAGRAIDELVVELPGPEWVDGLVAELSTVEGVDVEFVVPVAGAVHDPRLDALETAAILVGAGTPEELMRALVEHSCRTIGATWAAVVDLEEGEVWTAHGPAPASRWLAAFVEGTRMLTTQDGGGPSDMAWAPLPATGVALVLGRDGTAFRALERRHVAALARIADTRFRDLSRRRSMAFHPSTTGVHHLS